MKATPRPSVTVSRKAARVPICRLVFIRVGTGTITYGKWEPESRRLHAVAKKFNDERPQMFDVYLQDEARPEVSGPSHIPARGARPGQLVYRYRFSDGSTGDLDALTVERNGRDQLARYMKLEEQARQRAKVEAGHEGARQKREKRGLDARDKEIRQTAADERKRKTYGYIQRTAILFPGVTIGRVKQIITRKT